MNIILLTVGSRYPVDRKKIRHFVDSFLKEKGIEDGFIDISIVGRRRMTKLNEAALSHEGATDVLSFPQYDKGSERDYESTLDPRPQTAQTESFITPPSQQANLGDVVVCFPEAVNQAMKRGKMVDDHICSLIEHGLSHLLGIHHE